MEYGAAELLQFIFKSYYRLVMKIGTIIFFLFKLHSLILDTIADSVRRQVRLGFAK